jgi:hypothetical protein
MLKFQRERDFFISDFNFYLKNKLQKLTKILTKNKSSKIT